MSTVESLDLKNLHVTVLQEFQSEDIQELDTDFFKNLSNIIGKLKNEEYDGIEKKAKNQIISTDYYSTEISSDIQGVEISGPSPNSRSR